MTNADKRRPASTPLADDGAGDTASRGSPTAASGATVGEASGKRPSKHADSLDSEPEQPSPENQPNPQKNTQEPAPEVSINDVIDAVQDFTEAKKLQWQAQWQLVTAEAKVIRQSLLVTALATLATFAFACCCWLIINVTAGVMLDNAGVHPAVTACILLAVNGVLMLLAWRIAKTAFQHITVNPLIAAVRGKVDDNGKETQQ